MLVCWSAALAPLYYCTSMKTRDRDQQRPKIEKCWSAGLLPWLLCITVLVIRQEPGASRPAEGNCDCLLVTVQSQLHNCTITIAQLYNDDCTSLCNCDCTILTVQVYNGECTHLTVQLCNCDCLLVTVQSQLHNCTITIAQLYHDYCTIV